MLSSILEVIIIWNLNHLLSFSSSDFKVELQIIEDRVCDLLAETCYILTIYFDYILFYFLEKYWLFWVYEDIGGKKYKYPHKLRAKTQSYSF